MQEHPFVETITLGDTTFRVAPIAFGQAGPAWAAFDIVLNGTSVAERVAAMKGCIVAVCRAADPGFRPEDLERAKGVRPRELWGLVTPIGHLLGFELKEAAPGEAATGAEPAP